MAVNIKNDEVERLVSEVATLAGEGKTEAVKVALQERKKKLLMRAPLKGRRARIESFLRARAWPKLRAYSKEGK